MQFLYEHLFRVLIGLMGYMNWSPDFKMTGEKKLWKVINDQEVRYALDIGANAGQWAEMVLNTTSINVISIEPQFTAYTKLTTLKEKYRNRFASFNLALGNSKDNILINTHKYSSELSFIDDNLNNMPLLFGQSIEKEKVEMDTLDNLYLTNFDLLKNIDFIKIDVEGYEKQVLLGANIFLKEVQPAFIQIEINWHLIYTHATLFQFSLLLPNYNSYKILPSGKVLYKVDPSYPINNIFQLSNFLFVRKDINI